MVGGGLRRRGPLSVANRPKPSCSSRLWATCFMWGALRHKSCCTQSANACEMTGREERRRPVCTQTRFCIAGGSTWQPRNVPAPDPNPDLGPRGRGYRRRCVPLVMNLTLRAIPRSGGAPQAEKCPRLRTQIRIWVLGGPKSRFGSEVVGTSRSAQRVLAARSTPGLSCSSIKTTSPSGPHGGGPKSGFGSEGLMSCPAVTSRACASGARV